MHAVLPQLAAGRPFLADGGLETDLVFHHGIDLPAFASFPLLDSEGGRAALRSYYRPYLELARRLRTGLVLETPTWRANAGWAPTVGYGEADVRRVNRDAVAFLAELRDEEEWGVPVVVSANVGPLADGYVADERLTAEAAEAQHRMQIDAFAGTAADAVTALTMTYTAEAIGVTRAAVRTGLPVVIAFTVETDGKLPSGETLGDAIQRVDAETDGAPAYYMVNCAHPTHFLDALEGPWTTRIRGVRANASTCSHAELDEAEELDEGDPILLAQQHRALSERLPGLAVVGGCCGTDVRHVAAIGEALLRAEAAVG
jgi:homocysteine S-methyltransferase